jgi:hypothetical protein
MSNGLKARGWAAAGLLLLPVAAFYALLAKYQRNVPIMDDYHAVIEFTLVMRRLPSVGSKLLWIVVAQHNDYKLILLHMLVAAQWAVTGRVSLEWIIVLGNVLVLGMLWLFWRHSFAQERDVSQRLLLFVPVAYLLMQLNWVENLDWAINDVQTVGVLFFAMACLHFLLQEGSGSFGAACACGVLACFSSANGFLLVVLGLPLLWHRRQWAQMAVWVAGFAAALGMYAYRYEPFGVTRQLQGATVAAKGVFLLSLMGSAVENMSRFPVKGSAIVLGALVLATFVAACWRRYDRSNAFAVYVAVWVLLSCALVTQGRSGSGITLSLTGRYKVYSDMLLVFCYVFVAERLAAKAVRGRRMLYAAAVAATLLLCAGSDYFGRKFLANRQRRVAEGVNEFEADPTRNPPMIGLTDQPIPQAEPQHDRVVLNEAIATGVYRLPPKPQR